MSTPGGFVVLLNERTLKWEVVRYYYETVEVVEEHSNADERCWQLNRDFWTRGVAATFSFDSGL
jgi:hypothetical protein